MAPVPKKKHTHSRSGKRRNSPSKRRVISGVVKCKKCGKLRKNHTACPNCGYYRD